MVDANRLSIINAGVDLLLTDLAVLNGNENESPEDFATRMMEEFKMAAVEDADTGVVIPDIPDSCLQLTSGIADSLSAVQNYKNSVQMGLNFGNWLSKQLEEACMEPTNIAQGLIDSETKRVEEAKAAQADKLEDLIIFKGLNGESMDHFRDRLRQVFDNYVTHRHRTGITVPEFPAACENTATVVTELEALIKSIADEETFDAWLKANLEACCNDRFEDLTDLIEVNMPMLETLQMERDDLIAFLHS